MIKTSMSLPATVARLWRLHQKSIRKVCIRTLRIHMRQGKVARGVTRRYNRSNENFVRITARFTAAEYDALHFVAAATRVSVSWIVFTLIQLWAKPCRRDRENRYFAQHDLNICEWRNYAGVITEYLLFHPKPPPNSGSPPDVPILA